MSHQVLTPPQEYKVKRQRQRINGKKISKEDLIKQAIYFLKGDEVKHQEALGVTAIGKKMNRTPKQIYRYLDQGVVDGLLTKDENGKYVIPQQATDAANYKRFESNHPITKDSLVDEWKTDLLTRKGGQKVESYGTRISSLETVCNTMHKTPRQLLEMNQKEIESMMKDFAFLLKEGKADIRPMADRIPTLLDKIEAITQQRNFNPELLEIIKTKLDDWKRGNEDKAKTLYIIVQGLRDYLGFYGITWARGKGGIMSQKVPGHAQYGDVRLTDDDLERANSYIISRWGLDSDAYRWFWIGIESCARVSALNGMTLEYVKHETTTTTTYIMDAIETKTRQIRGGKWTKYITRPQTQESIDLLKNRGGFKICDTQIKKKTEIEADLSLAMIEIYLYLGKTHHYFYTHTNHVMRHIGAHYWLAKGNYQNHVIVAKIGGWNTIDEMIKSYGELPPEKVIEAVENMGVATA